MYRILLHGSWEQYDKTTSKLQSLNYVRKTVYIMYDLTNSTARTTRIGLLEERRKSNP